MVHIDSLYSQRMTVGLWKETTAIYTGARNQGVTMKTIVVGVLAAALLLSITGCSQPMSTEKAGETYLRTACPINSAVDSWVKAAEEGDFESFVSDAGRIRDLTQNAAKVFTDETIVWPKEVQQLMVEMSEAQLKDASVFNKIANLRDFSQFTAEMTKDNGTAELAQEIRLKLNLSADTKASCVGFTY